VEARGPFGVKSGDLGFWGVRNFLVDIFEKRGGRTFLGVIKSVRTPGSQFYIKELHLIRKQKNFYANEKDFSSVYSLFLGRWTIFGFSFSLMGLL